MKNTIFHVFFIFLFSLPFSYSFGQSEQHEKDTILYLEMQAFADHFFNSPVFRNVTGYHKRDSTRIDTIIIDPKSKTVDVHFNRALAWAPYRDYLIHMMNDSIQHYVPASYEKYEITFLSNEYELKELVPNYWRAKPFRVDKDRIPGKRNRYKDLPLVYNISKPYTITNGLNNMHIALWHSHGWYYEADLHRWEWQRARLFQTVEDLYPMTFTLQHLVPMLENAGAYVMIPRERDWQTNEVIVDNDTSYTESVYRENPTIDIESARADGFAIGYPPYKDENPFKLGTCRSFSSDKNGQSAVEWIPDIPESGIYAVYVSYQSFPESVDDAHYTVFHEGGQTEYRINQQMGGGTWIYLGKFKFKKGVNPKTNKLVLSSKSRKSNKIITADAVKFGGGMGNIERNGLVSQRPRYQEGARYFLQYAGFPDTLIWNLNDTIMDDYADDYQCRGEWVSYLIGSPSGPTKNRDAEGLGIPIDLSFAFHTDAGISGPDTVIGTLAIYSTKRDSPYFPNGLSKMASRDLSDIVQTQIVKDIRAKYDSSWTRRGLWDMEYSEAYRPTVPAMLLELFSHQNFLDVRFGHEPQFRFDVSRAIYKGMLRFLSYQYDFEYIVQPLPVTHFQIQKNTNQGLSLTWQPKEDPLEETASPDQFLVYMKINDGDFDNGTLVQSNQYQLNHLQPGLIYSFKVTAVNGGGESFPSEILSACMVEGNNPTVLIINAFDRTGAPAFIDQGNVAGFMDIIDQGVPFQYDIHSTGSQYDFDKKSPWLDDDSPGHGASFSDKETRVIPGNTFDFSYIHGKAIKNAGFSFISVSDEAITDQKVDLLNYDIIDYLAGEEKSSFYPKNDQDTLFRVYPENMMDLLGKYLDSGGSLFISGAHIGTDIKQNQLKEKADSLLKFKWRTNHASKLGHFYFVDSRLFKRSETFTFNTTIHPAIYTVEAADAIEPADSLGKTLVRYRENNMSAGIIYDNDCKIIALGFPFESIVDEKDRNSIMKSILGFFNNPTASFENK